VLPFGQESTVTSSPGLDALFVGYENQENLGLRYIMSYLEAHGLRTELAPYAPGSPERVMAAVERGAPRLVGFSVIFQYTLHEFGELAEALRRHGSRAHFTAGGHFPSLCPELTLAELPSLDSVVRFEGELTTLELLRKLEHPEEWAAILGLAYRRDGTLVVNPPRPLLAELDTLPWPRRGEIQQTTRGVAAAPILASRGCLHNCSFCSIRQFYGGAPGPLRRSRSPRDVVAEMLSLYQSRGVRLFLFQDDDFASKSRRQRRWVDAFLSALESAELDRAIGWKISCRVDDVDRELVTRCRDHGLLVVYLGVESGSRLGLATLNKQVTVDQNLAAMHTLKDAGVEFDLGFMLFDPDSTLATLRENLDFLRQVAALGGPPISFVKMLPLAGTAIQKRLAAEGRLTGTAIRPDYELLDPRLDYYSLFVILNFSFRNSDPQGLVERLRLAYFDGLVARTFERAAGVEDYRLLLRGLVDRANETALRALEEALALVAQCPDRESVALAWPRLNAIAAREQQVQAEILAELDQVLEVHSPGLCRAFRLEDVRRREIEED
jgi:anaerobic magnesium-protoporphyrin IX monomethyl ester cyclase